MCKDGLNCNLVAPVEHLPDVAKHAVLDDDEGWRHLDGQVDNTQSLFHLKGVDVGVEGVGEPGSGHSIFIGAVVQLEIDCYCIDVLNIFLVLSHHSMQIFVQSYKCRYLIVEVRMACLDAVLHNCLTENFK